MLSGARRLAGGAGRIVSRARMPNSRRGKFALGAGVGLGGMAAISGRSSGANGLQAK